MSPEELRRAVGRALAGAHGGNNCKGAFPCAPNCFCLIDANSVLAVVREAMREPTQAMLEAVGKANNQAFAWGSQHGETFEALWSVAFDESPLSGGKP
jgi:hypothetical protein